MSDDPKRIGRYVIEGTLGRGAMGVIYRAHDPDIDRPVAIKLIHADLLHGEERSDFIARFRREAQAAGRCQHPNIVAIYDFALHDGNPFLAMEFVDGMTLAEARGRNTQMPPAEASYVIQQVLAALGAAHAMGIVHRDIKPANIMLTRAGSVKVTDFGISRIDASSLTGDGMVIGTPSYMSPEQCRGDTVDARSDLFSTGVVLYEVLAGAKPFVGRSAAELYDKLLHHDAPDIAVACPSLSPELRAVVNRSLAKDPADRFPSAEAMAAALRGPATQTGAGDRTIVLPGRPAEPEPGPGSFDREIIDTLERRLAEHVGPIARHMVASAVRSSGSVEVLCATLAAKIEAPAARDRFEREIKAQMSRSLTLTRTTGLALAPGELERLQTELARHVGPVARVLIKRALPAATSAATLWQKLAEHIDRPEDRTIFLRHGPR